MLIVAPWNVIGTCSSCKEIVLGEGSPYRPLDDERCCPLCGIPVRVHEENDDPSCPRCEVQIDMESGLVSRGPPIPPLNVGMKVQFQRRGVSENEPVALIGNQKARITGDSSDEAGIWWGEGVVTSLEPLSVEVISKLTEPQAEPTRLELLFPVTRLPWFAVDLHLLCQQSEIQPVACHNALRAWAPTGWENRDGIAEVELDAIYASELFHMLLNLPTRVHCLLEVHNGESWAKWSEHHMVVCYSRDRRLDIYPDKPPPGSSIIENCAFHTPFWVDLYRGEERLIRWGQPKMLKRRRYP